MEKSIQRWTEELERTHGRIACLFARSEVRERSLAHLEGLLSGCERKNSWQVAEWAGEASPYGMQYLMDRSRWKASAVQERLSEYVKEELGSPDTVLVLDETGFLKKGIHSAGVQRKYSGTAGRIENSQVGVFLCYAGDRGHVLLVLDRELYLPKDWVEDGPRRRSARCQPGFLTVPAMLLMWYYVNTETLARWCQQPQSSGEESEGTHEKSCSASFSGRSSGLRRHAGWRIHRGFNFGRHEEES